ncbi:ATP-binding protein [Psychromonas sp. SP041]|uniref:ATP-binding protein n=1 Tax=Psychromonas sp. SP041 TaxID=1365007 RepID=UPI0010C7B203|nr:ATP-binding protein [Psychromonas sp. SP041]
MNKIGLVIKESEISKNSQNVFNSLDSCKAKITRHEDDHLPPSQRGFTSSVSHLGGSDPAKQFSIINTIKDIDKSSPVASRIQHEIILALHRGISIASVISEKFAEHEMSDLKQKLKTNASLVTDLEKARIASLTKTESVIFTHVLSSYLEHALSSQDKGTMTFDHSTKVSFTTPMAAMSTFLYRLNEGLKNGVTNDKDAIALVLSFSEQILDNIEMLSGSLEGAETFTSGVTYEVKKCSFEVTGFERNALGIVKELVMDFVDPKEVIGNAIAKHQAMRLSKMILCYDFEKQKNPFAELGGHVFTFLGDGKPGTGKTTVIKMMCGLMKKYCDIAGYDFYYENFGPEQLSDYQSRSGHNAASFIKNVMNPKTIGFGTIDDIDQIAGKRGDKQSSSGQKEVTAALMEGFAGANTIIRGNCTFGMFSNFPEMIDDALRQRAVARFSIDGPQTVEDYTDIFALLLGENHKVAKGDVELYATQDISVAVKKGYESHALPHEPKLLAVYEATVLEVGALTDMKKIGTYIYNISKAIEGDKFSGRSVKNITDSIKVRSMDFDMPCEWFEDASLFLHKTYDEKLEMIKSLREEVTVGMVIQEINRFADSEFRYVAKSENVEVQKAYDSLMVQKEALKKVAVS